MTKPLVYHAGPIKGLSYAEATQRRQYMAQLLAPDIILKSPMRGKETLAGEAKLQGEYPDDPLTAPPGIAMRDRNDVMTADAVLFDLWNASAVSIGTMVEIGWADAYRKPAILLMEEEGAVHDHPFVKQLTQFRAYSLAEAARVLKGILLPCGA